jgi:sulfate permease, SulP family
MSRASARGWLRSVQPGRPALKEDALAAVPGAISSVPDGMAGAVLAGVNPVYGLYASFAGPIAGGLSASTRLMVITTTSAAALAAGSALQDFSGDQRSDALFLLTIVAGVAMIVAALLRLGVAANIVLSQIPVFTGATAEGPFALAKAWDVVTHPHGIEAASLLVGLGALALLVGLGRTPVAVFAPIVALVRPCS